jgi:hypothetical protein
MGEDPTLKSNKNYLPSIEKIKTFFENSKVYDLNQKTVHLP